MKLALCSYGMNFLPCIFAAIWPFVDFYAANVLGGLTIGVPAFYAIISVVVLIGVVSVVTLVSPEQIGRGLSLGSAFGFVLFFLYAEIGNLFNLVPIISIRVQFFIWTFASATVVGIAIWFGRSQSFFCASTVGLFVLVLIPVTEALYAHVKLMTVGATHYSAATDIRFSEGNTNSQPGIYSFILDTYTRSDILLELFSYDNSMFLDALKSRGFLIGTQSMSNYPWTSLSMSSALSMRYIVEPGDAQPYDSIALAEVTGGENSVVQQLRRAGYKYAMFNMGHYLTTLSCSGVEDKCLQCEGVLSEAEMVLLEKTPLAHLAKKFVPKTYTGLGGACVFTDLPAKLRQISGKSVFLLAHHMGLHNSLNVNSNCEPLSTALPAKWPPTGPSPLMSMQLDCLNKEVLAVVDGILVRDPNAIILISGDHGIWPECDKCLNEPSARRMRHAILTAMRLPSRCRAGFESDISPINHYRLMLTCADGKKPNLLPNRFFSAESLDPGNPKTKVRIIEWSTDTFRSK